MRTKLTTLAAAAMAAAAALLMSAGTASAVTRPVTPQGTPSCGISCFNLWNLQLGQFTTLNAYVNGDSGGTGRTGTPVNLHRYGNERPNGDWQALIDTIVGTTATPDTACGEGLLAPASIFCVNPQFAGSLVIEAQFTPFGSQRADLCAGLAPGSDLVSLQTCGLTNRTIWVQDYRDRLFGDTPWINGSAVSFSNPNVLTVAPGSTKKPALRLFVAPVLTDNGVVSDTQEFGFNFGVTP